MKKHPSHHHILKVNLSNIHRAQKKAVVKARALAEPKAVAVIIALRSRRVINIDHALIKALPRRALDIKAK